MKISTFAAAAIIALMSAGCASNSGVVPIGKDTYLVSRQAATGFTGLGTLKTEAFAEANQYCTSQKKSVQVVDTSDSKPPYILGNFPRTEVKFMCLDEGDHDLKRPKAPDSVVETRDR